MVQPKKILIVEDSKLLHNMYRMMLKKYEQCALFFSENGREGLDSLVSEPNVDLIIIDINMPVMTGIEFLEAIKNNDTYKDIGTIIISTEGKEADIERGLSLGADAYLTKPFQSADLHSKIEEILKKRSK